MQLLVVAVGKRMPAWVQQAWAEYARRFPRGLSLDLKEVPLARRGAQGHRGRQLREAEGSCPAERSTRRVPPGGPRPARPQWTTRELAGRLEDWMREERGVCFLVGGPGWPGGGLPGAG